MRGLDHVCSMDVVVVGLVSMVMILQSHHKGNESVRGNLKGLQQITFLKQQGRKITSGTGSPSWLALTPKRGMVEGARLGLCVAFFTPLIWDMGRFFLSFSLLVDALIPVKPGPLPRLFRSVGLSGSPRLPRNSHYLLQEWTPALGPVAPAQRQDERDRRRTKDKQSVKEIELLEGHQDHRRCSSFEAGHYLGVWARVKRRLWRLMLRFISSFLNSSGEFRGDPRGESLGEILGDPPGEPPLDLGMS
ncbi:hypothetical protein EYF80_012695 [Liparis tanakae]|uniref:Uncharacterized protein n=1 Tax=Liparis tanakae TaxID=230148 RepID=A0A4Z2IGX5_9TELE|nr:hypothetical protein EYF80_012695 [Liparis tanakae]